MSAGWIGRIRAFLLLGVLVVLGCEDTNSKLGHTDNEAPSVGEAINFSEVSATSATVSWGAADDGEGTRASALWYKLVRADRPSDIDTIEEVEAIHEAPELVQDYVRGVTSKAVSGLTPGERYAFAVVVRDNTGNMTLYEPATVVTVDVSAPALGSGIQYTDITANALAVSWGAATDDATASAELEYKVVRGANIAAVDTLAEVAAITAAPFLVQDFSAGLQTVSVTGLASSQSYAFAVVVRDRLGNAALYAPALVSTLDVTPPTIGASITFSNVLSNRVTINWGLANDTVTGIAGLKYKVVRALDAEHIDTIDEVEAITSGADLITDYASAITRAGAAGLASSSSYAFAVVVKDAAGNRALYPPATVTTLDISAPRVGTAISASNVTGTGLSLSWGAGADDLTPSGSLQYKVVKAATAAVIDTLEEVGLITSGANLLQDFAGEPLTLAVTGLTSSTSYAFAVVVRDQQGNQAIYAPLTQRTADDSPPTPGTALSFASVASTSLTVNWGKASDNVSAQTELQYKLVRAASAGSIDSIAKVDAITNAGAGLVFDFTADVATQNITGLSSSTSYAFALIVRDASGNKALYAPATVATLDVSAPTPGAAISFGTQTTSDVIVQWGAASDDITPASALSYKVVRGADAAAVDTLAEIDAITAAPGLLADYTDNLTTVTASGLTSSTTYAFAVVVRDAAGNRSLYAPALGATRDVTAPVLGSGVVFFNAATTSVDVDWGAASDDVTAQASLEYKLVMAAAASDVDTVAEANAITGAGLIQDFAAALTSQSVTGLTAATSYAFAVVVRDAAGNLELYPPQTVMTLP
jgi:hypothetical protein